MARGVLWLGEVRAQDGARAGGKAASLGELAGNGFPVPPGFVVSAEACRSFFEELALGSAMGSLEGASQQERDARCAALQRRIVEAELPGPLAAAIGEAHARLVGDRDTEVPCAVRSSATAEDLAGASFAGQHGTYYYVAADRLLEMVRRCWASLFSPEAVSYRETHGIAHASTLMAVVVQEMVRSEVSGVAFTVHPVTSDRGEIVIESSWGMGAAIVDGRVTPDRYVVTRPGLEVRERRIAEKRFMVPHRLPEQGSERLISVPHDLRTRETLGPADVRRVAEWSLRCEEHFGTPQDVEWAIAGGSFHLLQSRPVTTLGREEIGRGAKGKYVLFKSLAENFTDPLTPLAADVFMASLPPGFRLLGGRLYMDLAPLRAVTPLQLSDEDLAKLLYLSGEALPPLRLSLLKLPAAVAACLFFWLAWGVVLARTRGMPDDFMEEYRALCRGVEENPSLDPVPALHRLWLFPGLFEPVGRMAVLVNGAAAVRSFVWAGLLKALLRRFAPGVRADAVALLCSGAEGVLSAEMGRGILALARKARREPRVVALLAGDPEQALARLREAPEARDFVAALDGFLAVHGHRAIREFEVKSPRWAENPAPVLGMIRNAVAVETDPAVQGEKATRARAELEAEIQRALEARPLGRLLGIPLVRLAIHRARYFFKLRENSRYYHIMAVGSVRKKILGIEAELRREGKLKCKDDVFFLLWREVAGLRSGRLGWRDVEDAIRERRLEHVRLAKLTPPRTIGVDLPATAAESAPTRDRLVGQPASPGAHEGVARVILDPSVDLGLRPGEVLIAPYTDPAWTPLFLVAGAAVVEVGSYLSHAGTVAREFGMPCVVDATDCTRRIRTGQRVRVDGSGGVVHLLEEGP